MPESLNKEQQEAVDHKNGPLLMAAGAGSGKTRALTSRLKALIEGGVLPEQIIAITFTNKAADQMRERVFGAGAPKPGSSLPIPGMPFIGTFHALGWRLLKKELHNTGWRPGFSVLDADDSLSLVKKLCKEMDVPSDRFKPRALANAISDIKSELKKPDLLAGSEDVFEQVTAQVYARYEETLLKNNAFDFDDLIEKVVRLFVQYPAILKKYQTLFTHVLVDEYQDINTAQYRLIQLLAASHQNLSVVGDDAQCLPPGTTVATPAGMKKIELLVRGDRVLAASGNGQHGEAKISKVKKFDYSGPLIKITTTDHQTLRLTPNHLVFVRPQLDETIHYVYLMYRKDKGFRIGLAKGSRRGRHNKRQIGLIVRSNQEKADKMWILKVCNSRADAEYYEYYYAFRYGIPTVVFDTNNRSMQLTQKHVNQLFEAIDTRANIQELMRDELLYFSYPHWIPQGTIRHSARRLRIRLSLFDDRRKSLSSPWGMSRISINTKDLALKTAIEERGFSTRKGKLNDWRMEIARLNYGELEKVVDAISAINAEIECVRSACLTKNKRLYFQPASHVRPSMAIAMRDGNAVAEKLVSAVEIEQYTGPVYDLDVENVHNYLANNFVVHNSIYSFRGADFRNFLNFERDWPNAKVVKLEQNYRSTKTIVSAASALIQYNKIQKPKKLWTENEEGEPITLVGAEDPDTEGVWVASEIWNIIRKKPQASIAVLYRTNAQSRAIEQSLISENLPYKIFGGLKFYERKEIKDVIAGLKVALNPDDGVSAERLEKSLGKRVAMRVLGALRGAAKRTETLELIQIFMRESGYAELMASKFGNPQERLENIAELVHYASEFQTLEEFLERVSLLAAADEPSAQSEQLNSYGSSLPLNSFKNSSTVAKRNPSTHPVTLMTIHIAKGLEFDYVFVIGVNEGLLPHEKSMSRLEEVEEERRLMYVAMTRARQKLYLLFHTFPSRFLREIPNDLVEFLSPTGMMKGLPDEDEMWLEQ